MIQEYTKITAFMTSCDPGTLDFLVNFWSMCIVGW